MRPSFALLLTALACSDKSDTAALACEAGDPAAGSMEADLGGESWTTSGVVWSAAGANIQVVGPPSSGWNLTLVLQTADDGSSAAEGVAEGGLPLSFDLSEGAGGGFATLYPESGASYGMGASGVAALERSEGSDLVGCFAYEAERDGDTMPVSGVFRAQAL
jgi:hypothetical protein